MADSSFGMGSQNRSETPDDRGTGHSFCGPVVEGGMIGMKRRRNRPLEVSDLVAKG